MFAFHMDDSADAQRKKVFVVAGLFGDSTDWFEVERHWEKRLRGAGIEYFRASNCARLDGGGFERLVKQHGHAKARVIANDLLDDLKLILKSSDLIVGGLGVIMSDYHKIYKEPNGARVLKSDPYIHAHQVVITKVAGMALKSKHKPCVSFLYDESTHSAAMEDSWSLFKERNPRTAECMGTLAPLNDKQYPCIQMADLIANSMKRMFEKRIDSGQPIRKYASGAVELEEMREWSKRIFWIGYWEENFLRLMVKHNLKHAVPVPAPRRKRR